MKPTLAILAALLLGACSIPPLATVKAHAAETSQGGLRAMQEVQQQNNFWK